MSETATQSAVDLPAVERYLHQLQTRLCDALQEIDGGADFCADLWARAEGGGGGDSRILTDGNVFERAGVGFSHVHGNELPPSASALRPELAGRAWTALGVSVVLHPRNPYAPTAHMNVRFFIAEKFGEVSRDQPIWWFGGGFDLTPYYGFEEDCRHWHGCARAACKPFGAQVHPRLKQWCDDYFFLKHRHEPRGIGGLFFDDWHVDGFERSFALMRSVADHFLPAYRPIIKRRRDMPYTQHERDWQLYRRGRYVEFNLVWDRGTLFGLQSGGRAESILMSMPPLAAWHYDHKPPADSPEAELMEKYLRPRDWL